MTGLNTEENKPQIKIEEEVDVPPQEHQPFAEQKIPDSKVDELEATANCYEKMTNAQVKAKLKSNAFKLCITCIVVLILIYIGDTIIINNNLKNSELMIEIFELLKVILSATIGAAFTVDKNQ